MKKIPKISETEWHVMKIIWASSPITANDVIEKLEGISDWKPKTIKTLINRLLKKKVISFNKENRAYLYYPLVTEEECIKVENQSFLERIYGGSFNIMIANFLEEHDLSKTDIEELKKILEKKSK